MAEANRNYRRGDNYGGGYKRGGYDRDYQRMTYIEGSAVRRMNAMPYNWEKEQEKRREQEERERRERREQRRRRSIARRNQDKALLMTRGYVLFLTFAAVVTCTTAGLYIKLQSDITIRMENIAALESSVSNLQADNDATYKRLVTSVRMEDVRERAMDELGMSYPDEDQIVYYEPDCADFMSQYGEIPE